VATLSTINRQEKKQALASKSYKLNGPGLHYEIAVCIATVQIEWINGPYKPARWVDISIFRDKLM
jgi:hypothetical protein